jgi:hypothetical protein
VYVKKRIISLTVVKTEKRFLSTNVMLHHSPFTVTIIVANCDLSGRFAFWSIVFLEQIIIYTGSERNVYTKFEKDFGLKVG